MIFLLAFLDITSFLSKSWRTPEKLQKKDAPAYLIKNAKCLLPPIWDESH
jgi:hypothetical protein